jgi:WD40 repeat protein
LLRAVSLSPDGRSVLTGSYDRTAQLWDGATGKPIGPPFRHESQVWFVGFSSDGATALSGGQENSAYLWEVPHSTDEPTDRIDLAVEVETGLTLGPTASLSKLDVSAWRSLRDGLMTRSPSRPKASRSSISSR